MFSKSGFAEYSILVTVGTFLDVRHVTSQALLSFNPCRPAPNL